MSEDSNCAPISKQIERGAATTKKLCDGCCQKFCQWGEALWSVLDRSMERRGWLILLVLGAIWLLPGNDQLPLVDRDEPRFAYAAEEMLAREAVGEPGAWVVPTFNGVWRFDKPPFVYWWMEFHYLFGGYNDFTARLHSVIAMLICVILVWAFARRLYDSRIGFWSGFAFLTSFQVFEHGRLCVADAAMLMWTLAAVWAGYELLLDAKDRYGIFKNGWVAALIFWVSLALGFATKWVVPPVVVGAAIVGYLLLARRWLPVKNFKPISGVAIFIALTLAWAIPAWMATGGEFFKIGIGEHVIARGEAVMNARAYNPFFYFATIFVSLLPWVACIGGVFPWLRNFWGAREKFLVAWAGTTFILFSLAQTQLPHYILPAFPAILILIVASTGLQKPKGFWAGGVYRVYYIALEIVLALAAIIALTFPADGTASYAKLAGICAVVLLGGFLLLGQGVARKNALGALLGFILIPGSFFVAGWALREVSPALEASRFLQQEGGNKILIGCGFMEPSLTAYAQQKWELEGDYNKALRLYNQADSAALLVQTREIKLESLPKLWLKLGLDSFSTQSRELIKSPPSGRFFHIGGVNLGRFSWVEGAFYIKP
jgi:4-amino-4-deoxy-L-arabinose transferase-like glycosyltransferase